MHNFIKKKNVTTKYTIHTISTVCVYKNISYYVVRYVRKISYFEISNIDVKYYYNIDHRYVNKCYQFSIQNI